MLGRQRPRCLSNGLLGPVRAAGVRAAAWGSLSSGRGGAAWLEGREVRDRPAERW